MALQRGGRVRAPLPHLPAGTAIAERVRHSAEAASHSVPCSGSASAILDVSVYGAGIIAACAAHHDWLARHCWLNGGMNTG